MGICKCEPWLSSLQPLPVRKAYPIRQCLVVSAASIILVRGFIILAIVLRVISQCDPLQRRLVLVHELDFGLAHT